MIGFDDATLLAAVMGLVEAAKRFGKLPNQFAPVLAIVLGIAAGVFYLSPGDLKQGILSGIVLGLTAVGLYSGSKNVVRSDQ